MTSLSYEQLGQAIANMPPEARCKPVQIIGPGFTDTENGLLHAYSVHTVGELVGTDDDADTVPARSTYDNKYHPEDFAILVDHNPFSPDGDTYYTLTDEGLVGNVTHELVDGPEVWSSIRFGGTPD